MMNRKIAVLTLAGVMSAFSLNAFAAGESTSGTPSADGTSQTRDPAPKATNADPDAASLPQGSDGNTTDNGPNQWSWPDAATTPFRNEKNSNWEGAYRVPAMVR